MKDVKLWFEVTAAIASSIVGGCCQVLEIVSHVGVFRARLFARLRNELELQQLPIIIVYTGTFARWSKAQEVFANGLDSSLNGAAYLGCYDTSYLVVSAEGVVYCHVWVEGGNSLEVGDDFCPVVDWIEEGVGGAPHGDGAVDLAVCLEVEGEGDFFGRAEVGRGVGDFVVVVPETGVARCDGFCPVGAGDFAVFATYHCKEEAVCSVGEAVAVDIW
eukprot:15366389-Ditylum_brightwellii.AAC.3